jgi:hypothetical protein
MRINFHVLYMEFIVYFIQLKIDEESINEIT